MNNINFIAAGIYHSLALNVDSDVQTWGWNVAGQLGDGTLVSRATPTQVCADISCLSLNNITALAAGFVHSVALHSDGTVWTWGGGIDGQLGNGMTDDISIPTPVCTDVICSVLLSNITQVASGFSHTLGLDVEGSVWSWGWNDTGQLGNGTTDNSAIAIPVCASSNCSSYLAGIKAIAGGFDHTVGLKNDGTVWTWGDNNGGELGNAIALPQTTPLMVPVF